MGGEKNWDFNLRTKSSPMADPLGFKAEDRSSVQVTKRPQMNKALLEKKAWELAAQPLNSIGMNIFMLWMMGSSPGIISVMTVLYAGSSIVSNFNNCNKVFQPFVNQGVDCSLPKLAYFAITCAALGYVIWHASGMGILPVQSGDWISKIPHVDTKERIF